MPGNHDNLGGSNKLLSAKHAAEYLDMPVHRLRQHYKLWGIPTYRAGRELRFRVRDLDRWVLGQRVA